MTIINVRHRKGATTEAYAAKVLYRKVRFNATYDCITRNLVIDKWYLFEDGELSSLRQQLDKYFQSLVSESKAS